MKTFLLFRWPAGIASLIFVGCLLAFALWSHNISQGSRTPEDLSGTTARVLALPDLPEMAILDERVNALSQLLVPYQFNITSSGATSVPVTLVDVFYCGAENPTQAKLVTVGHPGPPPTTRPTRVLIRSDCTATLDNIARKALLASNAPSWIVAGEITLAWNPWALRLTFRDAATAIKPGSNTSPPANLRSHLLNGGQAFKTIATSGIQLTIEGVAQTYNLGVQFINRNIFLKFIPAAQVPGFDLPSFLASDTSLARITVTDQTSLIVKLPHAFVSNLLNTDLRSKEIIVQTSSDGTPAISVRNLGVSGAVNSYNATGRVNDIPHGLEANGTLAWQGGDLLGTSVNLDPILDTCRDLRPVQKLVCETTLRGKASVFSRALTRLHRDRPLNPIGPAKLFPLQLDGKRYGLRFTALRTQSTATALILYMDFILEGP